jgi:hypothetical protein
LNAITSGEGKIMSAKKRVMFIFVITILTFLNCNPHIPRKMLINNSENLVVNFDDNKIEITAVNWGGYILNYHLSIFYLYIYYYLKHDITIHKDVVRIEYEGNPIGHYGIHTKEGPMNFPNYTVHGNGHFSLTFTLSDDIEVKKGDKITITAPDFITYDGDTVSLGELTLEIGKFYR